MPLEDNFDPDVDRRGLRSGSHLFFASPAPSASATADHECGIIPDFRLARIDISITDIRVLCKVSQEGAPGRYRAKRTLTW